VRCYENSALAVVEVVILGLDHKGILAERVKVQVARVALANNQHQRFLPNVRSQLHGGQKNNSQVNGMNVVLQGDWQNQGHHQHDGQLE
jgi:hypothetical protein